MTDEVITLAHQDLLALTSYLIHHPSDGPPSPEGKVGESAYHIPMTPEDVDWGWVKKSDAYGIPAIFGVLGIAMIVFAFVL